jgi:Recombination endonuclease VII
MALTRYEMLKRWRSKNWDKVKAQHRRYYWKHAEQERARSRNWNRSHRKKCNEMWSRWYRNHPQSAKHTTISKRYGLGVREYEALLKAQGGKCAICRQPERATYHGRVRRLAIDHDHHTDRIRGLLCSNCNAALGHFRDNPSSLRAAIKYLKRPWT